MSLYTVKEMVRTVQGEGARAGSVNVLLRMAGCNAWDGQPEHRSKGRGACAAWCDSSFFRGEKLDVGDIVKRLNELWPIPPNGLFLESDGKTPTRSLFITGGEPALQLDTVLVGELKANGWYVALETNGSIYTAAVQACDWITCSPKKGMALVLPKCSEVKVVLPGGGNGHEGWTDEELEGLPRRVSAAHYFVQPCDPIEPASVAASFLFRYSSGRSSPSAPPGASAAYRAHERRCLAFIDAHPGWRISLQTHKLMGIP